MAVRPLIRPRARVIAPPATPALSAEAMAALPRVLSRFSDCPGTTDPQITRSGSRQPTLLRPTSAKPTPSGSAKNEPAKTTTANEAEQQAATSKPVLPAFWKSRRVIVAAGIMALVSAVALGYQFRPKQQIIVVHPAKQPAAVATSPASNNAAKPAFQPLSPATSPSTDKETTSTASLMPRATWPADKATTAAPAKNLTPSIQTAVKPVDTRTSMNQKPAGTENLPQMSQQFPQTPASTANTPSNAAVVYNPMLNSGTSPLASSGSIQNNLPPQFGKTSPVNGQQPQYTAAAQNYQPLPAGQPLPPSDGSFGAYGGARFEGQINPLPLRR